MSRRALIQIKSLVVGLALMCLAGSAHAACTNPTEIEGAIVYNADQNVPQICIGTEWIALGALNPSAGGGACTSPADTEGTIVYNADYKVLQYCDGENWRAVVASSGSLDPFSFTDHLNLVFPQIVTSNIVQITGITAAANLSISGDGSPEYRVCSNSDCSSEVFSWTSAGGSVSNNQFVQLRLTTSSNRGDVHAATVNIGTASDEWTVTNNPYVLAFITSTSYDADLGDTSGADSKCQARADAAGLPGTYQAWIAATAGTDPQSTFTKSTTVPYGTVTGVKIADDWNDLTDGSIDNPINVDEDGSTVSGGTLAWTNVLTDGTLDNGSRDCANWSTISTNFAKTGDANANDGTWTSDGDSPRCNETHRLYCFEQ